MIITWSLLSFLLFGFIAVLALNYAFYEWEEKKINELAKHIKPQDPNSILFKSTSSREFTTFDLSSVAKTKPAKVVKNIYDRTLILLKENNYPDWFSSIVKEIDNLRKNFWQTISRFWNYILSLTKPTPTAEEASETSSSDIEDKKNEKKLREVDETVDRVTVLAQRTDPNEIQLLSSSSEVKTVAPAKASASLPSLEEDFTVATIGLVSSGEKSELDMSLFERLESRILGKLKNKGLGHYDIWLELGDLYFKFGEKDKAREVFALVLKHSDGEEKEFARDRLIGL